MTDDIETRKWYLASIAGMRKPDLERIANLIPPIHHPGPRPKLKADLERWINDCRRHYWDRIQRRAILKPANKRLCAITATEANAFLADLPAMECGT